jgi:hypothetical protein
LTGQESRPCDEIKEVPAEERREIEVIVGKSLSDEELNDVRAEVKEWWRY